MFAKSQSVSLLACGGGGGGFSTVTCVEAGVLSPRESVQVADTVTGPGDAPVVLRVAVLPLPEMVPLVAAQLATVTGTLSGLVHVQVMLELPPACSELG
ncbi:MAG: hypothetical protein WB711_00375, partial [Terriglobales bacterium]